MNTPTIRFVKSAVSLDSLPQDVRPEVAILGRSNAGKSSLINAMYGTSIAKVSTMPGKTRTINFFDVGEHYRVVDMPGYGYAARAGDERKDWRAMVENYLAVRDNLVGYVLVMDIRRPWSADENQLKQWMSGLKVPMVVAATKADKLRPNEVRVKRGEIAKAAQVAPEFVFACSNLKRKGVRELEEFVFRHLVEAP